MSSKKLALIEQDPGKRMGNWEKLVHPVARRPYFVNKDTGQTCWDTPAEVRSLVFLFLGSVGGPLSAQQTAVGALIAPGGVRKAGGSRIR